MYGTAAGKVDRSGITPKLLFIFMPTVEALKVRRHTVTFNS